MTLNADIRSPGQALTPSVDDHQPVIGAGASAQVLRISESQVLKVFKPDLAPILAEREFAFATLAYERGVPSPRPIERRQVGSTEAIVYEFRRGTNLDAHTLPRPWRYRKATHQMADLHAAIHAIDCSAGLEHLPDTYRQKAFLRTLIGYSRAIPDQLKRRCLEILDEQGEGVSLCHGDMSPTNLMIAGGRCFVIDWSLATVGDPAGDVAFTWVGIRDLSQRGDLNGLVKAVLRRASAWYLDRYRARQSEAGDSGFRHWLAPAAAARLGAIEKAGESGLVVEALIALATRYCEEYQPVRAVRRR